MVDYGKKLKEGKTFALDKLQAESGEFTNMFEIGKPSAFDESVDPKHRIGQYLKAKMNVIDLLPCDYTLDLTSKQKTENGLTGMLPKIDYGKMEEYKKQCAHYGLGKKDGVRIYTTDDTNASDSLNNTLQDNYLQQAVNKMSEFGKQFQHLAQSVGANRIKEAAEKKFGNLAGTMLSGKEGENDIKKLTQSVIDVISGGHRISLPKVWSETNYNPNFQANIKLVSPYGHPKAVQEFIIKPLTYLLLLASPITNDGVSYGRPYFVRVDAYGLSHTPIGIISNITLRRGGNDTSFSIYRQPLTIDVSLDLEFLVSGFAGFSGEGAKKELGAFTEASEMLEEKRPTEPVSMPTVGAVIRSLRPIRPIKEFHAHTNFSRAHGWGHVLKSDDYTVSKSTISQVAPLMPNPDVQVSEASNSNSIKQSVNNVASAVQAGTGDITDNLNSTVQAGTGDITENLNSTLA